MPIARSISLGTDRPSDRSKTCRIQPKPNLADQLWALGFDPSATRKTFFSTFFSANQANRRGAAGFWSISKPFFFFDFHSFWSLFDQKSKKMETRKTSARSFSIRFKREQIDQAIDQNTAVFQHLAFCASPVRPFQTYSCSAGFWSIRLAIDAICARRPTQ